MTPEQLLHLASIAAAYAAKHRPGPIQRVLLDVADMLIQSANEQKGQK